MQQFKSRIVVLGAGVAGIRFILDFEPKIKNLKDVKISLIDQYSYHQYIHKLHEVAGGRTEPKDVIVPIKWIFRNKRVKFLQAKVKSINIEEKRVITDKGDIRYDILVIALGSQTCYYGIKGLEKKSLGLKSVEEARQIRKRVEEAFASAKNKGKTITFVIGGGGLAGVELAGEFTELLPFLAEKYEISPEDIRLLIVEALESILPEWDSKMVEEVTEILQSKGVELILNRKVVEVDDKKIILESKETIDFDLLLWTGGVEGVTMCPFLDYGSSKRVLINSICEAINTPDVYAIGDSSYVFDESTFKPISPSAHIAMEQASFLAKNLYSGLIGKPQKDYEPKYVGEIVSIGSEHAVGSIWNIPFRGWMARIVKKMIHLFYVYSIGGIKLLAPLKQFDNINLNILREKNS